MVIVLNFTILYGNVSCRYRDPVPTVLFLCAALAACAMSCNIYLILFKVNPAFNSVSSKDGSST